MNWLHKISEDYEWQPIGAPFRQKEEMPPKVHRESPNPFGLKPSQFDRPFTKETIDPGLYPEQAQKQQAYDEYVDERLSILRESLTRHLTELLRQNPERYFYEEDEIPVVVERFLNAMQTGQFHTSSEAFRRMCKELGIKPTEKGVANFIFPGA
ncbi:MAG: hypothetical protein ACXAC5_00060 [Promethearchaeota archaeon]